MADGIFPKKDADFNTYFGTAVSYLNTNAVRLGIAAGNLTTLGNLKTSWDIKFPLSQSENTATKTIIEEKTELRFDIEDLLRTIYDDIPKSALITADRNTLNLKERKPNAPREAIDSDPVLNIFSLGNLKILIECRVEGDETRPSVHPDADGIEFRSAVSSIGPGGGGSDSSTPPPPPPGIPPAAEAGDDNPPADYTEATDVSFSTKARFTKTLPDPKLKGKYIYVFARWVNLTDESKSSGWSEVAHVMIS